MLLLRLLLLLLFLLFKLNKQSLAQLAEQLKAVKIVYVCLVCPSFSLALSPLLLSLYFPHHLIYQTPFDCRRRRRRRRTQFSTNFKIIFTHECIRNFALPHSPRVPPGNVFGPKAIALLAPLFPIHTSPLSDLRTRTAQRSDNEAAAAVGREIKLRLFISMKIKCIARLYSE